MTPPEVLRAARALIAEKGWIQGDYRNGAGYCALGAVMCSTATGAEYRDARDAMRASFPDPVVTRWNDTPGRTVEEVLAAFDRAIALAEQEQK